MTDQSAPEKPATAPAVDRENDFRDPVSLTRWLKLLLILSLLLDMAATGSGIMEYRLLSGFADGTAQGDIAELAAVNDDRQQTIGFAQLFLFIVTGGVFLIWIHRANHNARALGASGMRFTPGWAVGWYFVPIASLWKPYQAMREIWQASAAPGNWRSVPTPPLLGWWWALYIANAVLGQLSYRLGQAIDGIDSAITASLVTTASDLTSIALDAVAIVLVTKIVANQLWQSRVEQVF